MPSFLAEYYSFFANSYAKSRWFAGILIPYAADNTELVANLSLDKDVVHKFLLHYVVGSSSAGRLIWQRLLNFEDGPVVGQKQKNVAVVSKVQIRNILIRVLFWVRHTS
jgi:hypothetical protein